MTKTRLAIVTFITFILIISVGFASWVLINPVSDATSSIDVIVYESGYECKYLAINGSESFDYYNTGFVENDATITDNGNITLQFGLKLKDLKADFKTDNILSGTSSISMIITLKYSDLVTPGYNIFGNSNTPINCSVNDQRITISNSSNSTDGIELNLTLNNINLIDDETINFTITYKVGISDGIDNPHAYFKENVFPHLKNMRFAIRAKVEGN